MTPIHSSSTIAASHHQEAGPDVVNHTHQGRMGGEQLEVSTSRALPAQLSNTSTAFTLPPHSAVTVAAATPDELDPAAGSSSSDTASAGGIKQRLLGLFRKTDLAAAVGQFNNRAYLASERQQAHLPAFRQSVQTLHDACQQPQIPAGIRKEISSVTTGLMHKLERIAKDKPMGYRTAATMLFSLGNVGLALLPTLTAHKNKDNQYFALLVAGYTKTLCMLMGIALNPAADKRSFGLHMQERHVPYLPPNLPYAISAFNDKAKAFEHNSPILFHSMAASFTAAVFVLSSAPHLVSKPLGAISDKIKSLFHKPDAQPAEQLTAEMTVHITALLDAVKIQHGDFQQRRQQFEGDGKELSDSLSLQLSEIDAASDKLSSVAQRILGQGAEGESQTPANNRDFAQKMAFVAIAGAVCLSSAATYYDEPAGLVDLGMDAGLTVFELTKTARSPSENAQQAASKFASYSGLSPLLLPFGIINKIPATHFTDSLPGLVAGTVFLTACNLTLPRPGGEAIANAVVKLLQNFKTTTEQQPDVELGVVDSGRFTELEDAPGSVASSDSDQEEFFDAQEQFASTEPPAIEQAEVFADALGSPQHSPHAEQRETTREPRS
ncbi:hypothetical protein QCD60_07965 [Pokkaliibacter sp. MBI-7]|uniref:hypothetical protein n=1 Tax=Pokkaliibacter sp. MBI-7 TaxID=3040600 RepID=UPI00244A41C0|nr:hypothetical protein [Pokkaliibacter sp. MBI-7]MDH2432498.1 hypothetical protein [Pokkaliibacter sp. MBI-7]